MTHYVRIGDMVELRGGRHAFVLTDMRRAFAGMWCTFQRVDVGITRRAYETDITGIVARAVEA